MEKQLTAAIHPIMMDRNTTMMDKEEKVIKKVTSLTLGFVLEAVIQLGFSTDSLKNNLGIKNFLRDHQIPWDTFKKTLEEAKGTVKDFKNAY